MIRIRHSGEGGGIYIYDDDAQPVGAKHQYWWDVASRKMCAFASSPAWDEPSNQVTDPALRSSLASAYELWKDARLQSFLTSENAYWAARQDSEKRTSLSHVLQNLYATLTKSATQEFVDGWKTLFPKGLCLLTSARLSTHSAGKVAEEIASYRGGRLCSFLLQGYLPLVAPGGSGDMTIKRAIKKICMNWPESGSREIELRIWVEDNPLVYCDCRFEFQKVLVEIREDYQAQHYLRRIFDAVLDIAEPSVIYAVLDDQVRLLLAGIGTAGVSFRGRLGDRMKYVYEGREALPVELLRSIAEAITQHTFVQLRTNSKEIPPPTKIARHSISRRFVKCSFD